MHVIRAASLAVTPVPLPTMDSVDAQPARTATPAQTPARGSDRVLHCDSFRLPKEKPRLSATSTPASEELLRQCDDRGNRRLARQHGGRAVSSHAAGGRALARATLAKRPNRLPRGGFPLPMAPAQQPLPRVVLPGPASRKKGRVAPGILVLFWFSCEETPSLRRPRACVRYRPG